MMYKKLTLVALAAICATAVQAEVKPACTSEQLQTAQAAIQDNLIQKSCPEIVYVDGNPDYKNTAFCANDACVKAIKKTKKALPKCSYNGVNVRKGTSKLVKACEKLAGGASGDDDDDDKDASASTASDASATPASSKTPKPSKTPKVSTAAPEAEVGKVIGAADGSLIGTEIGQPIGPAPAPTTVTPAPTPNVTASPSVATSKSTSSASAKSYTLVAASTLVAVVASVVCAAIA